MSHWYALYTKPRMEWQVAESLQARGLPVFAPVILHHGKRGNLLEKPFFPRYIFSKFEWAAEGWNEVRWTHGLSQVVTFDGDPAWLDDRQVGYLRERLSAVDGDAFLRLKPGEPVRLTGGSFRDLEAVFAAHLNGRDRVAVLLNILGRQTKVIVPLSEVQRINP